MSAVVIMAPRAVAHVVYTLGYEKVLPALGVRIIGAQKYPHCNTCAEPVICAEANSCVGIIK